MSNSTTEHDSVSAVVWLLDARRVAERDDVFFTTLLSSSERHRYGNFIRPERQRQFLLGRVILRLAVSRLLDISPWKIGVIERPGAAPDLVLPRPNGQRPSFSLSHSRYLIACAIGFGCTLGVDIEANDPARDFQSISEIVFHPEDRRWLAWHEPNEFVLEFYRLWCTREALFKLRAGGDTGSPLIAPAGWYSYSSVKSGFTTVLCSSRSLKTVQQVEVQLRAECTPVCTVSSPIIPLSQARNWLDG